MQFHPVLNKIFCFTPPLPTHQQLKQSKLQKLTKLGPLFLSLPLLPSPPQLVLKRSFKISELKSKYMFSMFSSIGKQLVEM